MYLDVARTERGHHLQRFEFAEELLRAAVQADPMHVEAQCQLGLVLNRRGRANEAAEYLNRVKNTTTKV
jgi:predicted Zn-dependent protease